MNPTTALTTRNAESVRLADVPTVPVEDFRAWLVFETGRGGRIVSWFGWPEGDRLRMLGVVAHDAAGELVLASTVVGEKFDSITPECPEAHWFERELAEQWGVEPVGHPWLKPIRFQPRRMIVDGSKTDVPGVPARPVVGRTAFFRVEGDEVHEVAVGPVHAGVIEPGHFRFQCHGENVYHLEISLGYQHRGVERAMNPAGPRAIHYMETLAGDTSIGHATAYAQLIEALAGCQVPLAAMRLRGIALELERMANHIGDLGALAGDVGYLPTMSYCGRLRGDVLNMTAVLCGNRFGRGLVRPGGTAWDLTAEMAADLLKRLDDVARDTAGAVNLLWDSPSVMARFEGTGTLSDETCEEIGLVGPAARAAGLEIDVRKDFPFGIYRYQHLPTCTWNTGDVFGRAYVRWMEVQQSVDFLREQLEAAVSADVRAACPPMASARLAVSLVEGWRGEICHVGITGDDGRLLRYKVVDPSFHNWFGLAQALRGQAISDFPLCNKSFNLSYCGHDL